VLTELSPEYYPHSHIVPSTAALTYNQQLNLCLERKLHSTSNELQCSVLSKP
jgi:hypothetical protein